MRMWSCWNLEVASWLLPSQKEGPLADSESGEGMNPFAGSSRALLPPHSANAVKGPTLLKRTCHPGPRAQLILSSLPSAPARRPLSAVRGAETLGGLRRLGLPWQTLPGASCAGGWEFRKEDECLGTGKEPWPFRVHTF